MRGYKWLRDGGRSMFTGFWWPLPRPDQPGEWVQVSGELALCRNGFHACRLGQLSHWLGQQLWVLDLGGQVAEFDGVMVAQRARLVEMVGSWNETSRRDFVMDCAKRVGDLTAGGQELSDVRDCADKGNAPAAAYITAVLAGEAVAGGARSGPDYDRGFLMERTRQSQWFAEHLGLA
jgi:hypothetical protein